MKYIFTVAICGTEVHSKPLTAEELLRTIEIYLANDITDFTVKGVVSQ